MKEKITKMNSMISAIVTVGELLKNGTYEIGYLRNSSVLNKSVYELPQDRCLNIPGYQREIRWSTNNIQVLVDDVQEESRFLGNVLLSSVDDKTFNIIDGQQRLTVVLMLIEAINKQYENKKIQTCTFTNESFKNLQNAIENDFFESNEEKKKLCIQEDILDQYETFSKLWAYTKKIIFDLKENGKLIETEKKLLESEINLIIQPIDDKTDEKKVCVDYFIDINNKNVKLDYIDILKAYAFKENFEEIIQKWVKIQNDIKETSQLFYYPMDSMLLHYMLCTSNKSLGYGVKKLSDELKLLKEAKINEITYEKGTDIELLITEPDYYTQMLDSIISLIEFSKIVIGEKNTYGTSYEAYIMPSDGTLNDEFNQNMFNIINGIIRSSDIVPKLLLMKYFVEVIQNKKATTDDYKLIYHIGILTTFFSAGKGDAKNRNEFSNLVLGTKWKDNLKNKAILRMKKSPQNIIFGKEIKDRGAYTASSGQFLARRVHAIINSTSYNDSDKKNVVIDYHPKMFYGFNESKTYNDEHFIINQKFIVSYNINKMKIKYEYKDNISLIVSHLGNYLFILEYVNTKLGNKTIKDKIILIEEYIAKGENVFKDKLSKIKFDIAKDIFMKSGCPTEDVLRKCSSADDATIVLEKYYEGEFIENYKEYVECLANKLKSLGANALVQNKEK